MKIFEFKKNWWAAYVFPVLLIPIWAFVIYVMVEEAKKPESSIDLSVITFAFIFGVVSIGFLSYIPICQLLTQFTSIGITRNYLLWKKNIDWDSIKHLNLKNNGYSIILEITLSDGKEKFQINSIYYKNSDQVIDFVSNKINK